MILKVIYLEYKHTIQNFCGYFCIEFINYMLKGKTLLDLLIYFLLMILKRTIKLLKEYLRMNNLELTDVNKYRIDEIN